MIFINYQRSCQAPHYFIKIFLCNIQCLGIMMCEHKTFIGSTLLFMREGDIELPPYVSIRSDLCWALCFVSFPSSMCTVWYRLSIDGLFVNCNIHMVGEGKEKLDVKKRNLFTQCTRQERLPLHWSCAPVPRNCISLPKRAMNGLLMLLSDSHTLS